MLEAFQFKRMNWHYLVFLQTQTSLCFCLSVSVSVCLWGNRGPLLTHLSYSLTYIHFLLFLCITLVLSIPAFLPSVSGVFEARAAAVASGVIQCDRMMSITQSQACWTSPQTASHHTQPYKEIEGNKHVDAFSVTSLS